MHTQCERERAANWHSFNEAAIFLALRNGGDDDSDGLDKQKQKQRQAG